MDLIFMGTPTFALPSLDAIFASKHKITTIVTMPDKPKGRHLVLSPSPVKEWALEHGIPVFQPENLRDEDVAVRFKEMSFDTALICAYGRIIPDWLLALPKYGCTNIHPSLLPKYRGPSPIVSAVLNGDKFTGTTIMEVIKELDSGAILIQKEMVISPDETGGTLASKLSKLSADLVVKALDGLEAGTIVPVKQDEARAIYTKKFTSDDGKIDWSRSAQALANQIRAFDPKPGSYFLKAGKRFKVTKARVDLDVQYGGSKVTAATAASETAVAGTVLLEREGAILVATGAGQLALLEVQPEGKTPMAAPDIIHGRYLGPGDILG